MAIGHDKAASVALKLSEASACIQNGRLDDATVHCRAALALDNENARAIYLLGTIALRSNRPEEAAELLSGATRRARREPAFFNAYGIALQTLGRYAEASRAFRRAIALKADFAGAHRNLGASLAVLGDRTAALISSRRAIALDPRDARAYGTIGVVLMERGQTEDAIASYRRAIELDGRYAEAHFNLGNAIRSLGQFAQAAAHYSDAIAVRPGFADAHANRAYLNLLLGRFEQGWRDYEWRVEADSGRSYIPDPRMPGRLLAKPSSLLPFDLRNKRLLIVRDQGLGDELFFLRFAEVLRRRGARLAYFPHQKLAAILSRTAAVDEIVAEGAQCAGADRVVLAGELALIAGCNTREEIPPPLPLVALAERLKKISGLLATLGSGPWLGLTWRAGDRAPVAGGINLIKEIPLADLGAAATGWRGDVAVLQRNPHTSELAELTTIMGRRLHDLSRFNDDLEDMLALMACIDEYAGVSNTNMHLRAGLSRQARVLIPDPPEWRWLDKGNESPWFPGFSVYRQDKRAGWQEAVSQLCMDLKTPARPRM